ncbi:MAG: alpha/beta fold hydrolase [Myxococcaceae bacterium]
MHIFLVSSSAREHFIRVDGFRFHWSELGEGPPVVLLHGLGDSHRTWSKVAPWLGRAHRVFMPDLAGHGLSDRPDASYTLEWHAGIVGTWLDALGLDRVSLVGHSYGGGVAQFLLLLRRDRIRRVALVSAGGLGREVALPLRLASLPYVLEHLGQPFMARGTRVVLQALSAAFDPVEVAHLSRMNAVPGTARAMARSLCDVIDWRGQCRHFLDRAHEVVELPPVALFWGERDPVIPFAHALEAASTLDGVALTRFSGCGHYPHRECPEQFARALQSFVDAHWLPNARLRAGAAASGSRLVPFTGRAWDRVRERARAFIDAGRHGSLRAKRRARLVGAMSK